MESKFTYEKCNELAKWFFEHNFVIFHGDCGSRNVQSDGFFWWSKCLVKYDAEDKINDALISDVYETHEQQEEDEYYDELQYTIEDNLGAIESFMYGLRWDEDYDVLINYISNYKE